MFKLQKSNQISNRDQVFDLSSSIFEDFFQKAFNQDFFSDLGLSVENAAYPKLDIQKYKDRVEVSAAIPGMKKEDVKVDISDGILTIEGSKQEDSGGETLFRDFKKSSFRRSISLGFDVKEDESQASYKDGVLTVSLPLSVKEPEKPKKKFLEIK